MSLKVVEVPVKKAEMNPPSQKEMTKNEVKSAAEKAEIVKSKKIDQHQSSGTELRKRTLEVKDTADVTNAENRVEEVDTSEVSCCCCSNKCAWVAGVTLLAIPTYLVWNRYDRVFTQISDILGF